MTTTTRDFLILGAGLAGLSAAYHIDQRGGADWTILEKSDRAGGLCKSIQYDGGFTFDQSIHILYSADPYATELIKRLLNGNLSIQKRESWVFSHDVYTPYPWQANTYGMPSKIIAECLLGVIKATYEKNTQDDPANFEEWCHATFGEGFSRNFMIPYNQKLWAVDPKEMTDAWIKDRVMTPPLNEVIEGALCRQDKGYGPNSVFWYPQEGGIESLPKGFSALLDNAGIFLNTEADKILWQEKRVVCRDGKDWQYKQLVSTLPLPLLVKGLEPEIDPTLQDAAGRLVYNTVYAVNLAVQRQNISPYHWVYFPENKYLLHRISYPGNFSPSMVPAGWSSITVEVSASPSREVPTGDKLIERVLADLKDAKVLLDGEQVEVVSVLTLKPAYIIYNHDHRSSVDSLHDFLKENSIYSCGRFGEWEYLNMDQSILSGKRAVEESFSRLNTV